MENTDRMQLDDLQLNQKQKLFENWIQHVQMAGNHPF